MDVAFSGGGYANLNLVFLSCVACYTVFIGNVRAQQWVRVGQEGQEQFG